MRIYGSARILIAHKLSEPLKVLFFKFAREMLFPAFFYSDSAHRKSLPRKTPHARAQGVLRMCGALFAETVAALEVAAVARLEWQLLYSTATAGARPVAFEHLA